MGNRLTKNATAYAYDAADQMIVVGAVIYGYDNHGNQTRRGDPALPGVVDLGQAVQRVVLVGVGTAWVDHLGAVADLVEGVG